MFIWSFKTSKKEIILLIIGIIAFIGAIIFAISSSSAPVNAGAINGGVSCRVEDSAQRENFLRAFGWEIDKNPTDVREIIIPIDFSPVYEKYNQLQKQQGFDLENYKGKKVKLWTYHITNYPEKDNVYANMLVFENNVIGGDVCSYELDGFMHGFNAESGDKFTISARDVFSLIYQQ
ncbi:MAG: DUF4830 domain-containing protein [Clostridia bacterium]|nr:DUF4830 domain-containing protein [Clostridia bacterium]